MVNTEHLIMDLTTQPTTQKCLHCKAEEQMPAVTMSIHQLLAIMKDFEKRHKGCQPSKEITK